MPRITPMVFVVMLSALAVLGATTGSAYAQRGAPAPDAETHKQWMNDAADVQEDLREAMAAKDGKTVATASVKLEDFMAETEAYWNARKAADIVKLAQTARTQSKAVTTAATAGKLDDAKVAFEQLSATCNTCHELHPEKR